MTTLFLKCKVQIIGLIWDILVTYDGPNVDSLSMQYFYQYFADISTNYLVNVLYMFVSTCC